jgi:hypothetical protein
MTAPIRNLPGSFSREALPVSHRIPGLMPLDNLLRRSLECLEPPRSGRGRFLGLWIGEGTTRKGQHLALASSDKAKRFVIHRIVAYVSYTLEHRAHVLSVGCTASGAQRPPEPDRKCSGKTGVTFSPNRALGFLSRIGRRRHFVHRLG